MRRSAMAGAMLLAASGTASASPTIVSLSFEASPDGVPELVVRIATEEETVSAAEVRLEMGDAATPTAVTARSVERFDRSNESLALVILVEGSRRFLGDPDGFHADVKQAIDTLVREGPKRTVAGLYVYGAVVDVKVPLGPPQRVTGDALGPISSYLDQLTKSLRVGLREATDALPAGSTPCPRPGRRRLRPERALARRGGKPPRICIGGSLCPGSQPRRPRAQVPS